MRALAHLKIGGVLDSWLIEILLFEQIKKASKTIVMKPITHHGPTIPTKIGELLLGKRLEKIRIRLDFPRFPSIALK